MESLCDLFVRRQLGTNEFSPSYLFLPSLYKLNTFVARTYIVSAQLSRLSFISYTCVHTSQITLFITLCVLVHRNIQMNGWSVSCPLLMITNHFECKMAFREHPSWISPYITVPRLMQRLKFKKEKDGKYKIHAESLPKFRGGCRKQIMNGFSKVFCQTGHLRLCCADISLQTQTSLAVLSLLQNLPSQINVGSLLSYFVVADNIRHKWSNTLYSLFKSAQLCFFFPLKNHFKPLFCTVLHSCVLGS